MWIKKIGGGFVTFVLSCFLVATLTATVAVAAGGVWAATALDGEVAEELFLIGSTDRTTRLYYYDEKGRPTELVSDRISGYENALYCPLSEMPEHLKNAFVAIEDKRFYEHGGIDWARTAAAVLRYLRVRDGQFGGSTITQQLVKNLTGESEKSVSRKVSELLRAVKVEKELGKEEILEQYLNVVNLSENCYGVRTAANAYFSKEPRDLTLAEAASIAAITNNPSRYNPIRHPQSNRARRDLILSEMYAQGMIGEQEYRTAVAEELALTVNRETLSGRVNSWYADMVVSDVIRALCRERGMSEATASRLVYCGGLRIYTAMNPEMQRITEEYYADEAHFPTHGDGKHAQSAMLIVDPKSGDILAVAGAIGEKRSNRIQNFATDTKRPSGSVIKPLSVYAPALEKNLVTYATVFDDVPRNFRQNGAPWPRNSPDVYRGLINVNTALTHSVNTVSVSLYERLGGDVCYRFLHDELGFVSLSEQGDRGAAALALGQQSAGVTLRETVGGYTALANGGVYTGTRSFYKVVDSKGELLLSDEPQERRVLDASNASILTLMLRQVVENGTGKALTLKKQIEVAGKTGTSGRSCDKWFVGYTPELLAGVWYGHEYPQALTDIKGNPALAIFDAVLADIYTQSPAKARRFTVSEDVIAVRYCRDSGKLPCDACRFDPRGSRMEVGYFKRGTEPHETCDRHVKILYCDHGGVATPFCPEEECHTTALLRVSRVFPRQIKVMDAPYTYGGAMPIREQYFSSNEPYYALNYDSKRYFGVEMGLSPYNRICPVHTADDFWSERVEIE
ncbi:MAG: transglycosylase domain-containing protein [Clostridia bacterium]|nr:transglycosylase domain-containing protein [Clostridia bacterium]